MYTIKQAADRSGVSVPLLRAWERRYGVVRPTRTASGYRLYDDAAIARLRAVRQLIDQGWSARNASAAVSGLSDQAVGDMLTEPSVREDAPLPSGVGVLVEHFVAAARSLDQAGMEAILDEVFSLGSFEQVADGLLLPMMTAIGDAWHTGELDVASEHLATQMVQRRLGMAFQAAGRPVRGIRPVVVGLPPGSRHELGALAFAIAARRSAVAVLYLGPDLPEADWVTAARDSSARAAVIAVPTVADAAAAARVADALRESIPNLLVAFGGSAAAAVPTTDGLRLSGEVAQSVDRLRSALG